MTFLKTPFITLLCAALATPAALYAQKGKSLSKAAKKLEEQARSRTREISSGQGRLAAEHRLLAVQEVRRALARNPNLPLSPSFTRYLQTLREMGVNVPVSAQTGVNPALPEWRTHYKSLREQTFKTLSQEIDRLEEELDAAAFPLEPPRQHADLARAVRTNALSPAKRDAFQHAKHTGNHHFSWGTPGVDEIHMGPARLPSAPKDPLYACRATAKQLAEKAPQTLGQAFDFIIWSHLTPPQKNQLLLHLAQVSDLVGPDLTLEYMRVFRRLPAVKARYWLPDSHSPLLETYARNTQTALIEELINGQVWTEAQTDVFLDLAAFLPPKTAKDVLGALTYLEPKAALWLLQRPESSPVARQIRRELQNARERAQSGPRIFRTPFSKPLETAGLNSRLTLLYTWSTSLTDRLARIQNRIGAIEYTLRCIQEQSKPQPHPDKHQLAQKLYVEVRLERLYKLRDAVYERLEKVETEINSISAQDAHYASGARPYF